jgi:hypothetical protein
MDLSRLNLERFVDVGTRNSRRISVTRSFSFGFPPAFFAEHGLDAFDYVEIYFDKQQLAVAFRFLKGPSDASFKFIKYAEGTKRGGTFVAKSFFTGNDIQPDEVNGKYDVERTLVGGDEVYVIQLQKHPKSPILEAE